MSFVKNEEAEELYPELVDYLAMFDPKDSVTYPPATAPQVECDSKEVRKASQWRKTLIQAGIILLAAALIVSIFIFVGITALPELA